MGFFSKAMPTTTQSGFANEQDAYAAIMFAVALSDGEIASDEIKNIVATILSKKLFAGRNAEDVHQKIIENLAKFKDLNELLNAAVYKISNEQKEPLFATLVDMVLADGVVNEGEQQMLEKLKESLNISDALTSKIIEVLLIKNR